MSIRILLASALALSAAVPSFAATINGDYKFTIVQQTRALGQNVSFRENVILSDGSVVTTVTFNFSNANTPNNRIEVVKPDGSKRVIDMGRRALGALSANDAGQIAVEAFQGSGSSAERQLLLIEPDNSLKVLISRPVVATDADPSLGSVAELEINESGDIVASGSAQDANGASTTRIIKISDTSSTSPQFQILDETDDGNGKFVGVKVAIDDNGTAMWNRRNGDANEVVLSDGVTEQVALFSQSPFDPQRLQIEASALTNSGLLAVAASSGFGGDDSVGTSDTTDMLTDEDYDKAFDTAGRANRLDANEFGQVLAVTGGLGVGADTEVTLDGEKLLDVEEDTLGAFLLDLNNNSAFGANDGQFINDAGQFTFQTRGFIETDTPELDRGTYNLVVRADPIGATPDHAILPNSVVAGVSKVSFELVNGLGVDTNSPIYVDPVFGQGLNYTITNGGPNFTSIVVPTQNLGGLSMFDVVFGGITQTVGFGETIDFSSFVAGGVSSFDILGANGATSFTGDFVAGFTFASQGSVAFDISPVSVAPVPVPASVLLLLGAIGCLFTSFRKAAPQISRQTQALVS